MLSVSVKITPNIDAHLYQPLISVSRLDTDNVSATLLRASRLLRRSLIPKTVSVINKKGFPERSLRFRSNSSISMNFSSR